MNARSKVSSKGQIVVPKGIRDAEGWSEGAELEFVRTSKMIGLMPVEKADPRFPITWEQFEASRVKIDRFPTDAEIKEILPAEAARRFIKRSSRVIDAIPVREPD